MVKITTGFIDVYQSSDEHIGDIQRFDGKQKFKEIILSDSSDSESSSFDDSDENDDMTTCLRKLKETNLNKNMSSKNNDKQKFQSNPRIDMLCSPRLSRKRYTSNQDLTHGQTRPKIDILYSPRMSRKQYTSSNSLCYGQPRSTIDAFCSPRLARKPLAMSSQELSRVQSFTARPTTLTSGDLNRSDVPPKSCNITSKSAPATPTSEEDEAYQRNSYLLSPRIKRKQIDITKSSAYKEIYASNLRLYSAVLAKQIASSGQIGREMNEMRRNRIKEKALEKSGNKFVRSFSFAAGDAKTKMEDKNHAEYNGHQPLRSKRSNSAGALILENDIQNFLSKKNEERINVSNQNKSYRRTQSVDEHSRTQSETETHDTTTSNTEIVTRRRAATLRSEHLRQKIRSFDETMDETNKFLDKVKTAKK